MTTSTITVDALARQVRGPVVTPDDERYDAERAGYQTARWHRPHVVVGATGVGDVRAAVAFATANGLPVAVQGTGHALFGIAGDGGVLITTARMTGVRVDAAAGTAWVAAGTRWEQVIHEAAAAGWAPLSGSLPTLGVTSYTLAGGLGLMSRRHGYAADRVRAIDVVTADGRGRHVTRDEDPDLFWALRGGRDNFGVVTGLELDLVPVTELYGGQLRFPGERAEEVFAAYLDWTATVPDGMGSSIAQISFPDAPGLPPALRGRRIVQVRTAYTGDDLGTGARLVAPLRALGPEADTVGVLPYTESGTIHNEPPVGGRIEADTAMLRDLDGAALSALLDDAGPLPHIVELRHLGGRLAHRPAVPNAVGNRDAHHLVNVVSRLERATPENAATAHDRVLTALTPWRTGGRLLNFMNGEHSATRVRSAYDEADWHLLREIKATHDPGNTFRLNHNIPPATS